jgi:hypothetical protein
VSDYYLGGDWRERQLRREVDRENLRARRMAALEEALREVRAFERDVLDDWHREALDAAAQAVDDLRRTW